MLNNIRTGDRVTVVNRFGQKRTGTAVMRGPAGWVLNMGGRHGTPHVTDGTDVVKVVTRVMRRADVRRHVIRREV